MISINLPKNLTFGMKLLYALLGLSIVIVIVCVIIFNRNTYLAKSMKLVRADGTVRIERDGGKIKQIKKNARFQSGDALITGAGSLASVSLDDTKIITLQAESRAEFTKMNKQLALKLTKGSLFFEVTQKLNDDETFEIKTSTLTAGIKGTSGYFYVDEEGRETLTVTDGKVIISAVNPESGERKYAEVSGGQKLVVFLYSESNNEHDTIELEVIDLTEEDFTLKMLGENERLLTRVCEYTGWDRMKLKGLISALIASNKITVETTPSSEDTSEPETSPEDTETQGDADNTPTPTPTEKETDKPEATATPKPKATTAPKAKATATPKPKAKATSTPKPTSNTQGTSGSENDPTQGGGGEPTQGGGGEPTQGGGGEPTQGGGGEPTQGGGGEPTQGGGGEPTQGGGGEPTQGGGGGSSNEPTQGNGGGSNDDDNTTT